MMKRIFTGFLLAPAASVLSLLVGGLGWTLLQEQGHLFAASSSDWAEIMKLVLIVLGVAYAAAVVFGLPTLFLFRRKHVSRSWAYALAGGFCALLACSPFMLFGMGCDSEPPVGTMLSWLAYPVMAGGIGGLVFWLIAVREPAFPDARRLA